MTAQGTILVINCGSSSVKFAVFADDAPPRRLWSGRIERIGLAVSRFVAIDASGTRAVEECDTIADHRQALEFLFGKLERNTPAASPVAVGHRVVHGGTDCDCPLLVSPSLEARLRGLAPLAPLHMPHNLAGIAAVKKIRAGIPQVACFDTAFHRHLPRLARLTGLPRRFYEQGIRRYGFHGLSYEYVIEELRARHGDAVARGRLIVAHLGNGASMSAIRDARSVETSMGFSTLSGLPMGTRSGDLDPGIVLYLITREGMTPEQVQALLYRQSGLAGVSGISRNMRELLDQSAEQAPAAEAVAFFCYRARAQLAALTAALGGLDRLVFTGGIGANAPQVRAQICNGLGYLGITLDAARNADGRRSISVPHAAVVIEAFPTDEELMIARHVQRLLERPALREA